MVKSKIKGNVQTVWRTVVGENVCNYQYHISRHLKVLLSVERNTFTAKNETLRCYQGRSCYKASTGISHL